MSRNIRWYIPFKSVNGNIGRVDIYEEGYSGTSSELVGGAQMITTDEDRDDDMLLPVRGQSGYLRIMDIYGDHEQMVAEHDMQHYVEITVNSSVVWCGYIAAAAYSVPWDSAPLEVQFPLKSGLSVLESTEMDSSLAMVPMTMAAFLDEAIGASGIDYTSIYYPAEFTEENGTAYYFPFQCECSRNNFFDYELNANEEGSSWKGRSYKEMLEIWCRLWGWSLHERGKSLYFVSRATKNYEMITRTQLQSIAAGEAVTPTTLTANTISMGTLVLDGDSNMKDYLQGYKRINVNSNVNEIDGAILDLGATGLRINFYDEYEGGRPADQYPTMAVYEPTSGTMELKAYKILSGGTQSELDELTETVNIDGTSYRWFNIPAAVIYENDEDRTAIVNWAKPRDKSATPKVNYSISRKIRINKWQMSWAQRSGSRSTVQTCIRCESPTPFVYAKSQFSMNYNSGALVITGSVGFLNGDYYTKRMEKTKITDTTYTGLYCKIKVGDKCWDGESWSVGNIIVRLPLDPEGGEASMYHPLKSNKDISMVSYNGETGFIIPVEGEGLSGEIEFWIYDGSDFTVTGDETGVIDYPIFCIKDLSIRYNPGLSTLFSADDRDTSKNTYTDKTGSPFKDEKNVDLEINTENYNGSAYSTLTKDGDNVTTVQHVMFGLRRVELCLLGTLKRIFGRIVEKLTIRFEKSSIRPIDMITRDDRNYHPIAESVDWIDDSAEYTMEAMSRRKVDIYVYMTSAPYSSSVRIINYYASEDLDVALPVTVRYKLDGVEQSLTLNVQSSGVRSTAGGTGGTFEWVGSSYDQPSGDENIYTISLG